MNEARVLLCPSVVDCCAPYGSGIVDTLRAMGHDASGVPDAFGEFEARHIVTNPPYSRGVVDAIAEATIARVRTGQVLGVALLMRANWDLAQRRAHLFALPEYAGQTRMRFRPWWSEERKAQPIHNFVWHVWAGDRPGAEPVVRYWPLRQATQAAAMHCPRPDRLLVLHWAEIGR